MAILIKGMEMPKNCRACRLKMNCDDCEGLECVCLPLHTQIGYLNDLLTDKRRDDCPLAPVPEPHGNLIDADEIFVEFVIEGQRSKRYKLGEKWELNGEEIRSAISRLPTIIPASEEG